jgi:hypothetical protein
LDVLERAPIEILTAEVRLAAVDQEVLRVQDTARELLHRKQPHVDRLRVREAIDHVVVRLRHRSVAQETHVDAASGRALDRGFDRIESTAGFAAGVELGEVERLLRAVDHLEPHVRGVGDVGVIERGLERGALDELDR